MPQEDKTPLGKAVDVHPSWFKVAHDKSVARLIQVSDYPPETRRDSIVP